MTKTIRSLLVLAAIVSLAGAMGFAQSSGEATFKAKCQNCHGPTAMADTAVGKALNIKPVTDPWVRKLSEAQMIDIATNGWGRMQAFKDKLTDEQIKDAVDYFRTFIK